VRALRPAGRISGEAHGAVALSCDEHVDDLGARRMPDMTAEDLAEHLETLAGAEEEDLDQLLHDLLVQAYPTKRTQDS
jgi:hypothetical protein